MNKLDYLPFGPATVVLLFPYWQYEKMQAACSGFGFLFTGRSFTSFKWSDGFDPCSFGARLDFSMMIVCLLVAGIVGLFVKKSFSGKNIDG